MFNPFEKQRNEKLSSVDLARLIEREVQEGWVVEYKETWVPHTKIARSIASFANTRGGWYFVGVKTDAHHVANDICGYDATAYPDGVAKLRDVISDRLSPSPRFYAQTIPLENGRHVLAVEVPEAESKPVITSEGRIYRRFHDMSDPVGDINRGELDRMYESTANARERWQSFASDQRSEATTSIAWLSVYCRPVDYRQLQLWTAFDASALRALHDVVKEPIKLLLGIEGVDARTGDPPLLDYVMSGIETVEFRHLGGNHLFSDLLSLELRRDGSCRLHIPINDLDYRRLLEIWETGGTLRSTMEGAGFKADDYASLFDPGEIFTTLLITLSAYDKLLRHLGVSESATGIEFAIELQGIGGMAPKVALEAYESLIATSGIPVIRQPLVRAEASNGRGYVASFPDLDWLRMVLAIALSGFGLPYDVAAHAVHSFLQSRTKPLPEQSA